VNLCGTRTSGSTTGTVGVDAGSTSAVAIDGAGCAASPIVGYLDGFGTDAFGNTTVNGWACAATWQNPVMVQVFAVGNQSDGGTLLNVAMANQASSTDINAVCQTTGAAHSFSLAIPRGLQKQLVGKPVYIFGLSPVGAGDTPIGNSGALTLTDPTGSVTGHVEGIFVSNGQSYITGWACAYGMPDSIDVHYYSGAPAGSGQFVDAYTANLPSEPTVSGACGDSTNSPHRFMIPLAEALQDGFVGQSLYLHGISPSGGDNPLIQGSGSFSATAVTPAAPQITQEIENAASFASNVAPGALASIFGVNFGIGTQLPSQVASALPLPNGLNGVAVTVNGAAAPAFFASPGQINFQVPYGTASGVAKVYVTVNGQVSNAGATVVSATAPGIFTYGSNQAVVQNQDYRLNDTAHPAKVGSVVTIYLTGLGALDHFIATGAAAPDSPLSHPRVQPTVAIGAANAPVAFAGMTPGYVGLAQIDVTVPSLATGAYPVVITQGGQASNGPVINVTE